MVKVTENKPKNNVVDINEYMLPSDKINNRNINGSNNMQEEKDKYVTKDVFNAHMQRIDDKFDMLSHQIDNSKEDLKDNLNELKENLNTTIPLQIKNSILEEREYQQNQQKETRRFLWGTIGIGVLTIVVTIIIAIIQFLHG